MQAQEQLRPVVVGVSPTSGSPLAVRWAAAEAEQRKTTLYAVMVWSPPVPAAGGVRPPPSSLLAPEEQRADAERRLAEVVEMATAGKSVLVKQWLVEGKQAPVLIEAAEQVDAAMLVVGTPRPHTAAALRSSLLTTPAFVFRAPCPIVLVPDLAQGL